MTHTADNTDACLCTWGQSFEGELLGVTQRITVTSRRCPEHGAKPRHASAADNTDRQEGAMPCTCPPKTNNQKDPTIMQVEFTPAYLLGAWQEDPDCPRHGEQSNSVGGTTTSSEEQA